jgi:uncharacterized integral membrane protein
MAASAALTNPRRNTLMGALRFILGLLIAILLTAFAVANRQVVVVHWSPFHEALNLPLYLVALGLMALSFLSGSVLVWLNTIPLRVNAMRQKKQIRTLEKEVEASHVAAAKASAPEAALPPPASTPARVPFFRGLG